jgi:Protein of unknown function (DUF2505)
MATRRIEHTFECSVDTFWDHVFFNLAFNQRLFIERMRFERWEETSHTPTADGFRRVVEVVPRVGDLPAAIKGLMKEGTGYREEGEFFRSQSLYRVRAIPQTLADRIHISGDMRVETLAPNRCRRTYVGQVEAKVFGVGGIIENRILDDIDKGYQRGQEVTELWLRETGRLGT